MAKTIQTKYCSKCKHFKQLSEFSKNRRDGLQSYCKNCCSKIAKKYRQTERGKVANRKNTARYHKTEKGKAAQNRYSQSEKCKATQRHYHIRHPERQKAKAAVNHAIRDGKLPRANTKLCHYCPKPAQQYHHWKGYAPEHWLDFIPVCIKCHRKIHKSISPDFVLGDNCNHS